MTHTLVAHLAGRPATNRPLAFCFVLGSVVPDVFTRPFYIIWPATYWWTMPLHTPAGIAVLCWTLAQFFAAEVRGKVLAAFIAGAMLHLLLDLFQRHVAGGYYLFFPFSMRATRAGLWWPEDSLDFLPVLIGIVVVFEVARSFWRGSGREVGDKDKRSHDAGRASDV